ncbi:MAG: hypothetical protein PHE56_02340 [Bacteroidales bacterium]|nr:hypothetical protein [Bacteroidales bacterium]
MFTSEALWVRKKIEELDSRAVFPILNIGSATLQGRLSKKPSVEELLFKPLYEQGKVIHTDIQAGEGIDISGDLSDPNFVEGLKLVNPGLILCNNLLEHIINPEKITASILGIANKNTYIIVSVPYLYPYHYDPIDTMFRPNVGQLHKLFPGTKIISSEIVLDDKTYFDKLKSDLRLALIIFLRSFLPFYKPKMWWHTVSYLPNMFRKFKVTCILIQKK